MHWTIELTERGLVPTPLIRAGIRRLVAKRLRDEVERHRDLGTRQRAWLTEMCNAEIAPVPGLANAQHYEVPAAFYQAVLGAQLKYSAAYWPAEVETLDQAEEAMLRLTASRARLGDGQRVLELGCGWGSLSLWMARRFPRSTIVAVSNSASQRAFIESKARGECLSNVTAITADMNRFEAPEPRFDRVISVEMFEHMRNWPRLLANVRRWVADDGLLFIHVFAHRHFAYPFEATNEDDDWMGRHFFTGGMMPSVDLFERVPSPFTVLERQVIDGKHYSRTAEAWLANLELRSKEVRAIFAAHLGPARAGVQLQRWRLFFLACAELFAFADGKEWVVTHQVLAPTARAVRS